MSMPSIVIRPAVEFVEAREQRGDRRLAGAGWADEGDRLAGADVEVDVPQDGLVRAVAEGDVLVADVAAQAVDRDRVGCVLDVRLGVEQFVVAAESGDALRVGLEDLVDLLDRAEEDADQQQEGDELAFGQLAVEDEVGAGDHDDDLRQPHAEVAQRHAGGHDPVGLELGWRGSARCSARTGGARGPRWRTPGRRACRRRSPRSAR